ncbi:hypothetical protein PR048_030974 [Dryococelus australis]|uniref:Uncharacterized protein n=1 Tax=Dryococelus australis TaxID=614101 RepID=A0ABQ9G3Z7_9NEOP|nr:hypothetical protein PR048_030974 [Dryococelus australis]
MVNSKDASRRNDLKSQALKCSSGHHNCAVQLSTLANRMIKMVNSFIFLTHFKTVMVSELFVDKSMLLLAAVPEGLIDSDFIVEVECPLVAAHVTH